jgi:hypothetical protein
MLDDIGIMPRRSTGQVLKQILASNMSMEPVLKDQWSGLASESAFD